MKLHKLLSATCVAFAMFAAAAPGTASAQAQNVLQVATDATFPPMEFTENGQRTGFDVDLMNALAKAMGKQVQWTDIDFKGLIPGLIAHRFDAGYKCGCNRAHARNHDPELTLSGINFAC